MGNRQIKYEPDHDEVTYEKRKKVYIDQGYVVSEEKEDDTTKNCVMTKEKQPRVMLSLIK